MCGGISPKAQVARPFIGLSPRVRGNQQQPVGTAARHRSIPACAGESAHCAAVPSVRRVYPRVCGGIIRTLSGLNVHFGLSPRVRGNPRKSAAPCSAIGSIPACAGESVSAASAASMLAVYPRVCGGIGRCEDCRKRRRGLSPRVRGNPPRLRVRVIDHGSIPACAGESQG